MDRARAKPLSRQSNLSAPPSVFDVQAFLDARPMSAGQRLLLGLCFAVLMVDGAQTSAIAFVAPALTSDLAISRLALGPVLSVALVGLALGALLAGPLADRVGRKRVLVASVVLFSVWSLASATTHGLVSLVVYRFFTGLGVGAAMPNSTTLAAEFVPAKRRALLLNIMFCGFPSGASLGGFVAAWLIPHYGWRSVFVVGGVLPILLAIALTMLPESVAFMTVRRWPMQKIKAALCWVAGRDAEAIAEIEGADSFIVNDPSVNRTQSPLRVILGAKFLTGTLMLWLAYFMGLLLYFLLTSWMPILIRDAGYSVSRAASVTALFPLGGGAGALICGWFMDRTNATRVVSASYLVTAVLLLVLARSTTSMGPLMAMTFLAGVAMNGAQTSMPVLAATFYPTQGRASGVAWMLGIGRLGGVVGALAGGVLLQAGFNIVSIISGLAIAALIAGAALLYKDFASRTDLRESRQS
jgi:AAHS family 4-hydroxybenzoate transporter-like MFS transporter